MIGQAGLQLPTTKNMARWPYILIEAKLNILVSVTMWQSMSVSNCLNALKLSWFDQDRTSVKRIQNVFDLDVYGIESIIIIIDNVAALFSRHD